MDFKEFTARAEQDIREALESASPGIGVAINQVEKLQGESYTGLTVTPAEQNVGMNLNLNQLYGQMERGESYDSVISRAVDQAEHFISDVPRFNVAELSSYETAKELLFVDVVGTKVNAEMLSRVPHTELEDISMVYRMQVEQLTDGAATVLITNDLMNRMGVTKEQLHEDALANSQIVRPATMRSMAEVMAEMMGMPPEMVPMGEPMMYVVSTTEASHGAAAAFYPDFMDQAAKELGGNFFILPSSVHEMLFLPDNGNMKSAELKDMVTSINADVVSPEDRLTDSVYHYDAAERIFELGESWEARAAEKEQTRSVLSELADKKQIVGDRPKTEHHKAKQQPEL
ncbi:MAG: DUF5688 family protein [Eubacteriales bacterium]|nr:DUF5688 family protein [Eubacteriales bacterium]